jgi:phosphoribosylglycinamide formyltransferase-1
MLHLAVLGSGRGSNFQAILNAIDEGRLPSTRVCLVISNNSDAGILALARSAGIPALHVSQKQFPTEEAFTDTMIVALQSHGTELIVLAGYMKRVPPRVVREYRGRILNIHPALLPKFGGQGMYGGRVHAAVLASGDGETGISVHVVDGEYDTGAVLAQRKVAVEPGDDAGSLAARVQSVERPFLIEVLGRIASGAIRLPDRTCSNP